MSRATCSKTWLTDALELLTGALADSPFDRAVLGVFAELVAVYAEAMEYPPEVFTETVELEAELGIDSVKQTEIMGRLSDTYGLPKLPPHGYYTVFLVRNGKPLAPCGYFIVSSRSGATSVWLNAPYSLKAHDTWVVTKQMPGRPVSLP